MKSKIKYIIIWVLNIGFLIFTLYFSIKKTNEVRCHSINISIIDSTGNKFIEPTDVITLFRSNGLKVKNQELIKIDSYKLEQTIMKNQSVKKADVYKTITGDIKIDITQRRPIMRVYNGNSKSFYIDEEGNKMFTTSKYAADVLIINGKIPDLEKPFFQLSENEAKIDDKNPNVLNELFILAKFINSDTFWKSQIEQIYLCENGDYELIPLVGNQNIIFGNFTDYKTKFKNLKALYDKGFNKFGWNQYSTINLKYDKQVVCTRRNENIIESDSLTNNQIN